jgi:hypothetical protein
MHLLFYARLTPSVWQSHSNFSKDKFWSLCTLFVYKVGLRQSNLTAINTFTIFASENWPYFDVIFLNKDKKRPQSTKKGNNHKWLFQSINVHCGDYHYYKAGSLHLCYSYIWHESGNGRLRDLVQSKGHDSRQGKPHTTTMAKIPQR